MAVSVFGGLLEKRRKKIINVFVILYDCNHFSLLRVHWVGAKHYSNIIYLAVQVIKKYCNFI